MSFFFMCTVNKNDFKSTILPLCSQRLLFFKLQLKKTISDCRKYRFCLGIFSLHFHICTVVKEQDMYTELKSQRECNCYWRLTNTLPPTKEKARGKTKQHKTNATNLRGINLFFCTLQLCSPCETILCPFSDAGRFSKSRSLRKLRNKTITMKQKNKYFTTIHKRASEPPLIS